jgi:ATP-binding cassette subfamily B protein
VAERGTHAQLLELKGEYARMWELQREAAEAQAVLEHAEIREQTL